MKDWLYYAEWFMLLPLIAVLSGIGCFAIDRWFSRFEIKRMAKEEILKSFAAWLAYDTSYDIDLGCFYDPKTCREISISELVSEYIRRKDDESGRHDKV